MRYFITFLCGLAFFSCGALLASDWKCKLALLHHAQMEAAINESEWNYWYRQLVIRAKTANWEPEFERELSNFSAALSEFPEISQPFAIPLVPFYWSPSRGTQSRNFTGRMARAAVTPTGGGWNRMSVTLVHHFRIGYRGVRITLSLKRHQSEAIEDLKFLIDDYLSDFELAKPFCVNIKSTSENTDVTHTVDIDGLPFDAGTFALIEDLYLDVIHGEVTDFLN